MQYFDLERSVGYVVLGPLLLALIMLIVGVHASNKYMQLTKKHDSKEIIIDEVVGQTLTILVTLPITFIALHELAQKNRVIVYDDVVLVVAVLANVILFRFFDILKPWPINIVDQKVRNGFGVMLDDALAAVFSIIIYLAGLIVIVDFLGKGS